MLLPVAGYAVGQGIEPETCDFHGRIGLGTCASGVGPSPQTKGADELWSFVCDAAGRAIFHVMLTPNWNAEHKNHFHLEITPEANWMMVK